MKNFHKSILVLCASFGAVLSTLQAKKLPAPQFDKFDHDPMECLFKDSVAFMHHFLSQDDYGPRPQKFLRWMECKKTYCLEVAIPGADKDDVKISADENLLRIEAEVERLGFCREKDGENQKSKRHFQFATLRPRDGQIDKLEASMKNGLLLLTLPKVDKPEAKIIQVK